MHVHLDPEIEGALKAIATGVHAIVHVLAEVKVALDWRAEPDAAPDVPEGARRG